MEADKTHWLHDFLLANLDECVETYCTTCGNSNFVARLSAELERRGAKTPLGRPYWGYLLRNKNLLVSELVHLEPAVRPLSEQQSTEDELLKDWADSPQVLELLASFRKEQKELAVQRAIQRDEEDRRKYRLAVRLLFTHLWGSDYRDLQDKLVGCWSKNLLEDMIAHHERDLARQAAHQQRMKDQQEAKAKRKAEKQAR